MSTVKLQGHNHQPNRQPCRQICLESRCSIFKPNQTLCTVVLDAKKAMTEGGLHLPDTFEDIFITGTIKTVGMGRILDNGQRVTPDFAEGDRVMLAQHAHRDNRGRSVVDAFPSFMDDGVRVSLLDQSEIMGKFIELKN